MYVVGGFDGSRLNDVYHTAIQKSMDDSVDSLSSSTTRSNKQPTSAASGIMQLFRNKLNNKLYCLSKKTILLTTAIFAILGRSIPFS